MIQNRSFVLAIAILGYCVLLFGCGPIEDYGCTLPNQYELIRSNTYTIAIAAPLDFERHHPTHCAPGIAVSAKIIKIGISGNFVIGFVEASPLSELAVSECPGWFILNTSTDVAELGLPREEWEQVIKEHGISVSKIKLMSPKKLSDKG